MIQRRCRRSPGCNPPRPLADRRRSANSFANSLGVTPGRATTFRDSTKSSKQTGFRQTVAREEEIIAPDPARAEGYGPELADRKWEWNDGASLMAIKHCGEANVNALLEASADEATRFGRLAEDIRRNPRRHTDSDNAGLQQFQWRRSCVRPRTHAGTFSWMGGSRDRASVFLVGCG